jgi:hypothetical protein
MDKQVSKHADFHLVEDITDYDTLNRRSLKTDTLKPSNRSVTKARLATEVDSDYLNDDSNYLEQILFDQESQCLDTYDNSADFEPSDELQHFLKENTVHSDDEDDLNDDVIRKVQTRNWSAIERLSSKLKTLCGACFTCGSLKHVARSPDSEYKDQLITTTLCPKCEFGVHAQIPNPDCIEHKLKSQKGE